ncbi:class I adenylate-forming enzyme family protein [Thermodesulfobacteriota bacterium]
MGTSWRVGDAKGHFMKPNIIDIIRSETASRRKNTALVEGEHHLTYDELLAAVDQAAKALSRVGMKSFDRVALLYEDGIDYIILSLAVLSSRAVLVPISPSLSFDEIDPVLERMDVAWLIYDGKTLSRDSSRPVHCSRLCGGKTYVSARKARNDVDPDFYRCNPAFIRFSSGTTGASKGVVLSHESIVERTDAADKVLKITSEDVVIWVLSMSYHFVVTILLFLRRAATIVLCTGAFPESLNEGLVRHKGTFLYATPFHYHIMTSSELFSVDSLSCVRLAVTTAMKQPVSGVRDFQRKFGLELTEAYGIIEVGLPFINNSADIAKHGSVGRILPDYLLKIVNANDEGIGEVHLKGKGIFDAYFSPWQTRDQVVTDGWFDTGDLGKIDEEGFLYLVGREKEIINFAGMKIFPYEVESVLNQHPDIKESLVYGVAHPQYGELPCAKIVLQEAIQGEVDSNEIRKYCYKLLPSYKVPKEVHFVYELDRTPSGKLLRW